LSLKGCRLAGSGIATISMRAENAFRDSGVRQLWSEADGSGAAQTARGAGQSA
jgi:hypothetical protein